jgi:plasmid stabilization system protein ParE
MDFKVLIADSAIADLKQIVEFPFHDRRRGIRKMPVSPFLIYYQCDEQTSVVNILHFWHGARRRPEFPA